MGKIKKRSENRFNFFVEADIIKGKDEKGNDLIIIDGIASTSSTDDSDGETLYPSGFNLEPFLNSGLVNYNHQGSKDSNAIVGVPLEAKVINGGKDLYVKCALWPCPQTDGIVRAYDNFKKYNIDRKVGFSIEGNSTLRASSIKESPLFKKVLKADITGLAVTFSPKNKNSLMNIVKGEYENAYIELEDEEEINIGVDLSELAKEYDTWMEGDKTSEFYGTNGSVKEFLENNHEDSKDLLDELISEVNAISEKAMTTIAIASITPESVEHDPNKISNKKNTNFGKLLKKSDIYTQIAQRFPHTSIADQIQIYSFVEKVNLNLFKNGR